MLGIPYKTHISYINRVLNILDMEYLYYSQICIVIKLLHRHLITKKLITSIERESEHQLDIQSDSEEICRILNTDKETVIYYPDKTRRILIENYYFNNIDLSVIEEYTNIMQDYTIKNRNKLVNLVKVNIGNNVPIM